MSHSRCGAARAKVLVSHPHQQIIHQAVLAAHEAGMLDVFLTSLFLRPGGRPHRLAAAMGGRHNRYVVSHSSPVLAGARVRSLLPYDALSHFLTNLPVVRSIPWLHGQAWRLFDLHASRITARHHWARIVHAGEGNALHTLRAARQRCAIAVLDVPSAHEYFEAVERTAIGSGVRDPSRRHYDLYHSWIRAERRLADWLLVPSSFCERCLVEHGVARTRIVMLPYGADPEPARRSDRAERAGRVGFLFVGRVGRRKGVIEILRAWPEIEPTAGTLTLVGGIERGMEGLLRTRADVRVVGPVSRADVQEYLRSADVFVFPSHAEGSALAIFEAMGAGLPVITTSNARGVVRDGVDGFIIDPGDVRALSACMALLASDRELRLRMGESARRRIVSSFTWGHYRRRLVDFYRTVAAGERWYPTDYDPMQL